MLEPGSTGTRLEDLQMRWQQNPDSRVYLQLAEEYRKLDRHPEAIDVLKRGLRSRPNDLSGQVALGRCHLEMQEHEQAARSLETVIGRDPTHIVGNKLLLESYLQSGDAEKAGERLDLYKLLNPGDPDLGELEGRLRSLRRDAQAAAATASQGLPDPVGVTTAEVPTLPAQPEGPAVRDPTFETWPGKTAVPAEVSKLFEAEAAVEAPAADLDTSPAFDDAPAEAEVTAELDLTAGAGDEQDAALIEARAEAPVEGPGPVPEPPAEPVSAGAPASFAPSGVFETADMAPAPVAESFAAPRQPEPPPEPAAPEPGAAGGGDIFDLGPPPEPLPATDDIFSLGQAPPALELESLWDLAPEPETGDAPAPEAVEDLPAAPEEAKAEPEAAKAEPADEAPMAEAVGLDAGVPSESADAVEEGEDVASFETSEGLEASEAVAPETPSSEEAVVAAPADEPGDPEVVDEAAAAGESEPAEAEVASAVEPDPLPATATLGELYVKQGYTEEAEKIFRQVLRGDPRNPAALAGLERLRGDGGVTAHSLLASDGEEVPAGLTAKKVRMLESYLKHLRRAAGGSHVP